MTATQDHLEKLGAAFGSPATIDGIADAIITRSLTDPPQLTSGGNEREMVMEIISLLVVLQGAFTALEDHEPLPPDVLGEMKRQVLANPSATIPLDEFVNIVLGHVRSAFYAT